jgi:hypothetical protein
MNSLIKEFFREEGAKASDMRKIIVPFKAKKLFEFPCPAMVVEMHPGNNIYRASGQQ